MSLLRRLEQDNKGRQDSLRVVEINRVMSDRKIEERKNREQIQAKSLFRTWLEPSVIQVGSFKGIPYPGFDHSTDPTLERGISYFASFGKEGGEQWEFDEFNYCAYMWWPGIDTSYNKGKEGLKVYMYSNGTIEFLGRNSMDRIRKGIDLLDSREIEGVFAACVLRETTFK